MKKNIIAIRREDLSKVGERRVAIVPDLVNLITDAGHELLVQPAIHPESRETKRAFEDREYVLAGADVTEDLSRADVIFGLKEIGIEHIYPEKAYYYFSHTHKGQFKNRKMLRTLVERKATLIDYELIADNTKQRVITAFTYFAGYAGMIDSLWALGKRLRIAGIDNQLSTIPQSLETENLPMIKEIIKEAGNDIRRNGTPASLPPLIICILGTGKTSTGAQEILDLLPIEAITLDQLPGIFKNGSHNKVYKLVLEIPDMYRLKAESPVNRKTYAEMSLEWKMSLYLEEPDHFETNMDQVFPYCTLVMNCIIWSSKYPRLFTYEDTQKWYKQDKTLRMIGDITCDPEGAIQFSRETWANNPVFIYDPEKGSFTNGLKGDGIGVMAITNLPSEFPADASIQFSRDIRPLMGGIIQADYEAASPAESGLPAEIRDAVILWKGAFTPEYGYMRAYLRA